MCYAHRVKEMERERDEVITVNRLTKRFELPSLSTYQTRAALYALQLKPL